MTAVAPMRLAAFVINGAPRTKKNHGRRVWARKLKRTVSVPSEAFEVWEEKALWQLRQLWRGKPIARPVFVAAIFYRQAKTGDAVGYYQGLADILQKAGVVVDDKFIVHWDGSRMRKDAARPRVEIVIYEELP